MTGRHPGPGSDPGSDPGADPERERRLARRRLVRELHPDRGGDPAAYLAALAEFDAHHPPAGAATPSAKAPSATAPAAGDGEVVLVSSRRWRWPARLRRRLRDHRRRHWVEL